MSLVTWRFIINWNYLGYLRWISARWDRRAQQKSSAKFSSRRQRYVLYLIQDNCLYVFRKLFILYFIIERTLKTHKKNSSKCMSYFSVEMFRIVCKTTFFCVKLKLKGFFQLNIVGTVCKRHWIWRFEFMVYTCFCAFWKIKFFWLLSPSKSSGALK